MTVDYRWFSLELKNDKEPMIGTFSSVSFRLFSLSFHFDFSWVEDKGLQFRLLKIYITYNLNLHYV